MGALAFESLPLGFRFKPTDVELIDHYLRLKINGRDDQVSCIKEVDICRVEPWDLPDLSAIKTQDHEWFFFCPRDRKYPNGQRSNRATEAGYWKATGKDRTIKSRRMGLIGMKKTLVFYTGRAPKGQRTNWVIHEYRTTLKELDGSHKGQEAFVLCRLFKKADDLKPDDNDDGSHTDEVETNICSPNPTNTMLEEVQPEPAVVQASPVSVEQSVEQQMTETVVKACDSITSETIYSDHPQVNEETPHEVVSHFNEHEHEWQYDSPETYVNWISMHTNEGPGGMDDIFPTDVGEGHNGLYLQDINGTECSPYFSGSVIMNSDAPIFKEAGRQGVSITESDMWKNSSVKESGSCSGSEVETIQQQHDVGLIGCITSDQNHNEPSGNEEPFWNRRLADDDDIFSDASLSQFCDMPIEEQSYYASSGFAKAEDGVQIVGNSGIKIRPNVRGNLFPSSNFALQGTAPRRIRLHIYKDNEESSKSTVAEGSCLGTIAPHEDIICLADLGENASGADESESSLDDSEIVETGIKIRTHLQRSLPTAVKSVEQGTARRRIRLQTALCFDTEADTCKPFVADKTESCLDDGEIVDTGIKIRTHLQRSRPSAVKSVEQGTARRRIRLQNASTFDADADACKPFVAEMRNLSDEVCETQCADNSEDGPVQRPTSFKKSTSAHILKVVMVVFVFMAFFGLWIARNVSLLSS